MCPHQGPAPVWVPDEAEAAQTNLARFMKKFQVTKLRLMHAAVQLFRSVTQQDAAPPNNCSYNGELYSRLVYDSAMWPHVSSTCPVSGIELHAAVHNRPVIKALHAFLKRHLPSDLIERDEHVPHPAMLSQHLPLLQDRATRSGSMAKLMILRWTGDCCTSFPAVTLRCSGRLCSEN